MEKRDVELMSTAVAAFLSLVPSLAEEIERSTPASASESERALYRKRKGWTELCFSARRVGMEPYEYAKQIIEVRNEDRLKRH